MSGKVIYAPEYLLPKQCPAPYVMISDSYLGPWYEEPRFTPLHASVCAGGNDIGQAVFVSRYGMLRYQWESAHTARYAGGLIGKWIRVGLFLEQGPVTIFQGIISQETREVASGQSQNLPTGTQQWVAYEAGYTLQKRMIDTSFWRVLSVTRELDWMPAFNARDRDNLLSGNRSASKHDGCYLFGGTSTWTRRDVAEYILTTSMGSDWRLTGQVDVLDAVSDVIPSQWGNTVFDALRDVIHPSLGVDFRVIPRDDGFDIDVYALISEEVSWETASLPINPRSFVFHTADFADAYDVTISRSDDRSYGRIRVVGNRIVTCLTLYGIKAAQAAQTGAGAYVGESLVARWSAAQETNYKTPPGSEPDEARKSETVRQVYRQFGAPVDWDFDAGRAAVQCDSRGVLSGYSTDFQRSVRETLSWLPIADGYDYDTDPETAETATSAERVYLPAAVWVYDEATGRYLPCEEAGMSLAILYTDWGVHVGASPNHILALNHFSGADESATEPVYDYERLVATIAIPSDARVSLEWTDTDDPTDGVLLIEDSGAEAWWAAPWTVWRTDQETGQLKFLSTVDGRTLRNDIDRLALKMAGAIARYYYERARAQVTMHGLFPQTDMLGSVLSCVDEGGDLQRIQSVITQVAYDFTGTPRTTISAGYAR